MTSRVAPFSERICPVCRIRHYVPRRRSRDVPMLAPVNLRQLKDLERLAYEFIEAGGGESYDLDEPCEECGRWSVIAFLDWLKPDVAA